jgi:aminoglycoside phosphotransferase (APT) family kinase protein
MPHQKPQFSTRQLSDWLDHYHRAKISNLAPLTGGYWSTAYSYTLDNRELVLRLGESGEGFYIDEQAYQLAGHLLPIPEVIARGEVFDHHFAISVRHFGQFLEDVPPENAEALGSALNKTLSTLRLLPKSSNDVAIWYDSSEAKLSWHEWLLGGLDDHSNSAADGWRSKLRQSPEMNHLFERCHDVITELLPSCPSRGELIHGDLLHQNVLVNESGDRVTGIFSWKCSARGDFMYDIAWCTLWRPWFPVIDAIDIWQQTLNGSSEADLKDAAVRHHCYELQIAASHMGWFTTIGDKDNMTKLCSVVEHILDRGPLSS